MNSDATGNVIVQGLDAGFRMVRWIALLLVVLFWCSGVRQVGPEEVGLQLRFGKLHGVTAAEQVQEPGLLLALPYPIDQVIQVPTKHEGEVVITEVWKGIETTAALDAIDPVLEGYCLTGDQNIVQAQVVVKYRITDPIGFRLRTVDPEAILHDVVLASLTQTIAAWDVDDVLRLQRPSLQVEGTTENLGTLVWSRAQGRLDQLDCGLTLSALEFKEVHPPRHVIPEFREVQSAKIETETAMREAEGFAAREIPRAESERHREVKSAVAYENSLQARATAEMSVFEQLYAEYQNNPGLVANRIYLETIEYMLENVGRLDFVSPDDRVILSDLEAQP